MAWFTRFTRFGDAHLVYAQEAENSCGIACVLMTVFKINKFTLGRPAVHAERRIYDVYGAAAGATYDGSAYTYANHLATTLCQLDVGTWTAENIGANAVSQAIMDHVGVQTVGAGPLVNALVPGAPMITLVGWGTGGAHFVVVDTVNRFAGRLYASVCDPWDGDVHITPFAAGAPFHYVGAASPFSWDLGGTRHEYSTPSVGNSNGWVIRRAS
jgi:hypothetical protein